MQLQNWSVCQVCGRTRPRGEDGWIDSPRRIPGARGRLFQGDLAEVRVIRCPDHWSVWALRNSIGRTKRNLERMVELKARENFKFPPHVEPFPLRDEKP